MSWYRVIKTIKGRLYAYEQRTWREGARVRTENRYLGPVHSAESADSPTPRQAYHGAREGYDGTPSPSSDGRFGPGFYLTTYDRAHDYATHDAKIAADLPNLGGTPSPTHQGQIATFDLERLNLVSVIDDEGLAYFDLVDQLLGEHKGYATPDDKMRVAELLLERGYDGLYVRNRDREEVVIFPGSLHKLKEVTTTRPRFRPREFDHRRPPPNATPAETPRHDTQPGDTPSLGGVYGAITDQIVADLEAGVRPWHQPWSAGTAGAIPLRHNGEPYSGINVLMLWAASLERGFTSPTWMTFKQAKELGAHVRKGETGTKVVYANTFTKTEKDDATGEEKEREIPFLKSYTVFNIDQIEGLPSSYYEQSNTEPVPPKERIAHAEAFFAATGADIRHGSTQATYSVTTDQVQMPPFDSFDSAEAHAATLAHELIHWTRHPSRLGRDFGRKTWGDEGYAREELVAELGAAFLCADLDITPRPREEHAAYIGSWIKALKNDKRAIFAAAAHAQRAVDYLHSLQGDVLPLQKFSRTAPEWGD